MVLSELTVWFVQKAWSVLTDESEPKAVSESTGESVQKDESESTALSVLKALPETKALSETKDVTEQMAVYSDLMALLLAACLKAMMIYLHLNYGL